MIENNSDNMLQTENHGLIAECWYLVNFAKRPVTNDTDHLPYTLWIDISLQIL